MKNIIRQLKIDNGQWTINVKNPWDFLEKIFEHIVNFKNLIEYPKINDFYKGWF